jgi:hypothetical protein
MTSGETTELLDMIALVKSYQITILHIMQVILEEHDSCSYCPCCGEDREAVMKPEHNLILNAAAQYYTGMTDIQCSVLDKLANCVDEMIEIEEMIGMTEIKHEFVRLLKFLSTMNPGELAKNSIMMNMVIMAPPGHGKTEVAKLIAKAFQKSGLLTSDAFVEARRSDLIGKYCGHTAKQTTEMFDKARGGVIFIDEIYALGNPEKRDVFTRECINTIMQLLSERPDTICIIAGYEHEIKTHFFSYNPGLERRFPWRFKIKQYTAEDLISIFHKKMHKLGHSVEDGALLPGDLGDHKELFPNAGGDIVNLVTSCMLSYYDNNFMKHDNGRPVGRDDVLGGLLRYTGNRDKKIPPSPPPPMMYN